VLPWPAPQACELLLDQAGLLGDVSVRGFPLHWVPLEEDLLSLEAPAAFRELAVEGDLSPLHAVAAALTALQASRGAIPHIKGKGEWAAGVARAMARLRREQGRDAPPPGGEGGVDTLILLDRRVDMATPMCTQLTYEGLLDEVLGLGYGQIRGAAGVGGGAGGEGAAVPAGAPPKRVTGLTSADAVFAETRDRFYVGARRWLNDTLRSIQAFRDGGMHAADISRLKGFVADLRDKFARIPLHTELVEQLAGALRAPSFAARQRAEAGLLDERDELPAIEELMAGGEPLLGTLRLLCLYCAVHGGVPRRAYDALRRDVLNTYGHAHLLSLRALGAAGLLQRREGRRPAFPAAKAAFGLLLAEGQVVDDADPADIHFAYAGYAPLSVRLVQQALRPEGWAGQEAALAALPGPQFEVLQTTDDSGAPVERAEGGARRAAAGPKGRRRSVMVVFIGGVTYAEVSALRFLSRKGACDCDFVVATTKVVNGSTLLATLLPEAAPAGPSPH
jgi:hypothetical protein